MRLSLNNQTVEKTIEGIKRTPILDPTPSSGSSFLVKPFTSGLETTDGYFQELMEVIKIVWILEEAVLS